jgi:Permuted papain-like amidase enzyme, YaeF/YiiX, C92 family
MKKNLFVLSIFSILLCGSCKNSKPITPVSKAELTQKNNVTVLKECYQLAQRGDLILRMGDDFISQVLADIAPKEKKFSHSGIVEIVNGKPFVYSINPKSAKNIEDDTVRLEPIDSFLNPAKNTAVGLYRYKLSAAGIDSMIQTIRVYQRKKARFDMRFDIKDDENLYCTELIAKALEKSTNQQITFDRYIIDSTKVLGVKRFFKIMNNEIDLKKYPIFTLDNIYLNKYCVPIYIGSLMQKNQY